MSTLDIFAWINARYLAPSEPVELTFKLLPGKVYTGNVRTVLQAVSTGQVQISGLAVSPISIQSVPFIAP